MTFVASTVLVQNGGALGRVGRCFYVDAELGSESHRIDGVNWCLVGVSAVVYGLVVQADGADC